MMKEISRSPQPADTSTYMDYEHDDPSHPFAYRQGYPDYTGEEASPPPSKPVKAKVSSDHADDPKGASDDLAHSASMPSKLRWLPYT